MYKYAIIYHFYLLIFLSKSRCFHTEIDKDVKLWIKQCSYYIYSKHPYFEFQDRWNNQPIHLCKANHKTFHRKLTTGHHNCLIQLGIHLCWNAPITYEKFILHSSQFITKKIGNSVNKIVNSTAVYFEISNDVKNASAY